MTTEDLSQAGYGDDIVPTGWVTSLDNGPGRWAVRLGREDDALQRSMSALPSLSPQDARQLARNLLAQAREADRRNSTGRS